VSWWFQFSGVMVVSLYWCRDGFTVLVSWCFHYTCVAEVCTVDVVVSLYRCRGVFTVLMSWWFVQVSWRFHYTGVMVVSLY
jgi:uncharacterized membrane protein